MPVSTRLICFFFCLQFVFNVVLLLFLLGMTRSTFDSVLNVVIFLFIYLARDVLGIMLTVVLCFGKLISKS